MLVVLEQLGGVVLLLPAPGSIDLLDTLSEIERELGGMLVAQGCELAEFAVQALAAVGARAAVVTGIGEARLARALETLAAIT